MNRWILLLLLCFSCLHADSRGKARVLYSSLPPRSVTAHLALYELYPNTPEGKKALQRALSLLAGSNYQAEGTPITLPKRAIESIIALVNRQQSEEIPQLSPQELAVIQKLSRRLANRRLAGFQATSEAQMLSLPPDQVDLTRALFLSQGAENPASNACYEALIDLMALQVLAKLPLQATPQQKLRQLSAFIFEEMNFRFPPHSLYAQEIDLYTFLPSVLDQRRGVCLGVSILYAAIAQRIDLPLELITPMGHIFVRYRNGDEEINVETTLRGVHIDSEEYLGIEMQFLPVRNMRETVGLAHINQASVFLQRKEYDRALRAYQIAHNYLPEDRLLKELTGYTYLLLGDPEAAERLLQQAQALPPLHPIASDTLLKDLLEHKADAEGLSAILESVDETASSLAHKRQQLEGVLARFPEFRSGWFYLATTLLQMQREKEALKILEHYCTLDDQCTTVHYYRAALYAQRLQYAKAWQELKRTDELLAPYDHHPKVLQQFRRQLMIQTPEYRYD